MKFVYLLCMVLVVMKNVKKEEKLPPLPALVYYLLLIPVFVLSAALPSAVADTPDDSDNLLDGMAVRSFGRGTNGFIEEMNSFDIQRVEVIKGPASALYGSNALGGVINVITRDPPAVPAYRLWGELGNNDRGRGGVSAAGSLDAFGYFLDANALTYECSQDRTARARRAVSGKLMYDFETNARLSLRTEYLETEQESPGTLDQRASMTARTCLTSG